MSVRYTPSARGDIEKIYQYLEKRSHAGARNVLRAICAACSSSQNIRMRRSKPMILKFV